MSSGHIIKDLRYKLNLTQIELAVALNISQAYLSDIERDKKGLSERLKETIIKKWNLPKDYFNKGDIENDKNNYNIAKSFGGGNISVEMKDKAAKLAKERLSGIEGTELRLNDYISDENFFAKLNFQKRLMKEMIADKGVLGQLDNAISTITSFEYVISNLKYYYFNEITNRAHDSQLYISKEKNDYEGYKAAYVAELLKFEKMLPTLQKLTKSIEEFYEEMKPFDKKGIIDGYFGKPLPDTKNE